MGFELVVVSNTPMTDEKKLDVVAKTFLTQIGYLTKGTDPKIPYELFMNCFMKRRDKAWLVDELAIALNTSRPTIYRHLNKLKSLELLEEVQVEDKRTEQVKKGYRIRYGNLSKAWDFVEAHVNVAIENYRKTVDHLQALIELAEK
jgi:predicted transcriptional regulator